MIKNNSYYKGQDILNDNYKDRMINYFNPYEYNLDSNIKDRANSDVLMPKSKRHIERNKLNK